MYTGSDLNFFLLASWICYHCQFQFTLNRAMTNGSGLMSSSQSVSQPHTLCCDTRTHSLTVTFFFLMHSSSWVRIWKGNEGALYYTVSVCVHAMEWAHTHTQSKHPGLTSWYFSALSRQPQSTACWRKVAAVSWQNICPNVDLKCPGKLGVTKR